MTADEDDIADLPHEALLDLYRRMLTIRRFEEKAGQFYGLGAIRGYLHLGIGLEAVAVGLADAMAPSDRVITGHRGHAQMLAAGMDPDRLMAELLGRVDGYGGGRGGPIQIHSPHHGFFGGHPIVGAQASIGTGIALASRYREDGRVAVIHLGDGAADRGTFQESLLLARRWRLPAVFVIEDNRGERAEGPPLDRRGAAHDVEGIAVDGMDVLAVRRVGRAAIRRCREGQGPVILACDVWRYRGHAVAAAASPMTREAERHRWAQRDPVATFRAWLEREHPAAAAGLGDLEAEVRARIQSAAARAEQSPEPQPGEAG